MESDTGHDRGGIVKDGIVVLEPNAHLVEGQPVEATELTAMMPELPGFGFWKDRVDLVDAAEESSRIRRDIKTRDR